MKKVGASQASRINSRTLDNKEGLRIEETINDIAMRALISMGCERRARLTMVGIATQKAAQRLGVTDLAIIIAAEEKVRLATPHLYNFAAD